MVDQKSNLNFISMFANVGLHLPDGATSISYNFGQQLALLAPTYSLNQIYAFSGVLQIGSKFGHQVMSLALV